MQYSGIYLLTQPSELEYVRNCVLVVIGKPNICCIQKLYNYSGNIYKYRVKWYSNTWGNWRTVSSTQKTGGPVQTGATLLVHQGVAITTVRKLPGHTSVKTTQIYSEVLSSTIVRDLKNVQKGKRKVKMFPDKGLRTSGFIDNR